MSHAQRRNVVVEIKYEIHSTVTKYSQSDPPGTVIPTTIPQVDTWEKTYWAECARNETGDEDLQRWYNNVALPAARRYFESQINRLNQQAAEARKAWDLRYQQHLRNQGAAGGGRGQWLPPDSTYYRPFNAQYIVHGKPKPLGKPPGEPSNHKRPNRNDLVWERVDWSRR